MNPKSLINHFVYALVILLCVIALGLMILAPGFLDTQVIYQGF